MCVNVYEHTISKYPVPGITLMLFILLSNILGLKILTAISKNKTVLFHTLWTSILDIPQVATSFKTYLVGVSIHQIRQSSSLNDPWKESKQQHLHIKSGPQRDKENYIQDPFNMHIKQRGDSTITAHNFGITIYIANITSIENWLKGYSKPPQMGIEPPTPGFELSFIAALTGNQTVDTAG